MSIEDKFPKKLWKAIEFAGHALMVGAPVFGLCYILPWWVSAPAGILAGLGREFQQNWDDGKDESTLFMVSRLPVNLDMLIDIVGYALGTTLALLLYAAL